MYTKSMREKLPFSVDLRITGRCNLSCPFCFGPIPEDNEELDIETWKSIINKLWNSDVKCLVFTGGEPTLYTGLIRLLLYAKEKGFFVVLSSNGLSEELMHYCEYIDALSLPIDGCDYEQCRMMRHLTESQYNCVIRNMLSFKRLYPNKTLKIGTVVTKQNLKELAEIYRSIVGIADVWKLYQVSQHEKNMRIYHSELRVSDEQFIAAGKAIRDMCDGILRVGLYKNSERDGKYLFCEPNADAKVISGNKELIIGNFVKGWDDVIASWRKYVRVERLEKNVIDTYYNKA